MGKRKVGALEKVDADLASLQYKIRRDASSYKEDFQKQFYQYQTYRELFLQAPTSADDAGVVSLRELIDFVAHVADCYPDITRSFPEDLIGLLSRHYADLQHELRDKIVSSLTLLRNKKIIDSITLLETLFPILKSTESKSLRALLFRRIVNLIRSANSKATNHRLNRTVQTLLHNLITSDLSSPKGVWAVRITRELWRRRVWTDAAAVEIMKEASLADNDKLVIGGTKFFLGGDQEREDAALEDSDEDDDVDVGRMRHQMNLNKKSGKKEKELKKAAATVKRRERKKNQPHPLNFSALHLLRDPQGFAEKLFSKHLQQVKVRLNLGQKLLVLQLVSRLIGLHKLIIISFYSYFQRYLTPRQPDVTSFLASLAQGTHNFVPPDLLEPLVLKIANEFVSEAVASEVAAAGLNAIREICGRQPLAMNETLLEDLIMYRKSKDKSVMMAAKGLLGLYRDVGAQLLKKKDRGRAAALGLRSGEKQPLRYGEQPGGGIEGIELLERWKEEERTKRREEKGLPVDAGVGENGVGFDVENDDDDEENPEDWEVEEESDDSGGWIDVSSDDEIEAKAKLKSLGKDDGDIGGDESEGNSDEIDDHDNEDIEDADDKDHVDEEEDEGEEEDDNEDDESEEKASDDDLPDKKRTKLEKSSEETTSNSVTKPDPSSLASLATTRILTPADLSKLNELRTQASIESMLPVALRRARKNNNNNNATAAAISQKPSSSSANKTGATIEDAGVTVAKIEAAASLSVRATKEQKIQAAKGDRFAAAAAAAGTAKQVSGRGGEGGVTKGRPRQHMSRAAKRAERKREAGKSSTNKEKERKKNVLMTLGKARGKMRKGLVAKGKQLKAGGKGKGKGGRR